MKVFTLIFLCCGSLLFGQNKQVEKVVKFDRDNVQAIMQGEQVIGYYFFYTIEKASRRETFYGLEVYDQNLKQTYFKQLTRASDVVLVDAKYNGGHLCLYFLDKEKGKAEFTIFDNELNEKGSFIHQGEKDIFAPTQTLIALPVTGFAICGPDKNVRSELVAFSSTGQQLWTAKSSSPDKKKYETMMPIGATEKYLAITEVHYKKAFKPTENETWVRLLDTETGRELFRLKAPETKSNIIMEEIFDIPGGHLLSGFYYDPGSTEAGQLLFSVSAKGEILNEKYINLAEESTRIIEDAYTRDRLANKSMIIHKTIAMAGQNIFLVTELFDKQKLHDLAIFELDEKLEVKDIRVIKKTASDIGIRMMTMKTGAGVYLKMFGIGDYYFTRMTDSNTGFTVIYRNVELGGGGENSVNGVSRLSAKEWTTNKLKISSIPTFVKVLPAKDGYIALFEYFEKDKKVDMRLEKL